MQPRTGKGPVLPAFGGAINSWSSRVKDARVGYSSERARRQDVLMWGHPHPPEAASSTHSHSPCFASAWVCLFSPVLRAAPTKHVVVSQLRLWEGSAGAAVQLASPHLSLRLWVPLLLLGLALLGDWERRGTGSWPRGRGLSPPREQIPREGWGRRGGSVRPRGRRGLTPASPHSHKVKVSGPESQSSEG